MEDEAAGRGAGFDLFGQGFEVDLAFFELCDQADEIGQVAPEPVQSPDDECVAFTQTLEAAFQLRPADVLAASLFFVNLVAFGVFEGVLL